MDKELREQVIGKRREAPILIEEVRKEVKGTTVYRELSIDRASVDEKARTVEVAFSSEEPYERWWGIEILGHGEGECDLSRLLNGAPLLLGHETDERHALMQIGVVEKAAIDGDKRGRATVRFSRNERPDEIFRDVLDGIRTKISVGYRIEDMIELKPEEMSDDLKNMALKLNCRVYRCAPWQPHEVSFVPVAADDTVGVGRAHEQHQPPKPEVAMPDPKQPTPEELKAQAEADERTRVAEIEAIGKEYAGRIGGKTNADQLVKDAVALKQSAETFRGLIFERVTDDQPLETPVNELGLSEKDIESYSISRAIMSLVPNSGVKAEHEHRMSEAIREKANASPKGIFVPYEVERRMMRPRQADYRRAMRAAEAYGHESRILSVGSATAGGNLVGTDFLAGEYVDVLRNATILMQLGMRTLPGLVGNVAVPKKTGASTGYWVATEGNAPTGSQPTFGQITLSPKTVGTYTDLTRQLLLQGRPEVDRIVEIDIADSIGVAIDAAGFHGSGSSGQPYGIVNTVGVGDFSGVGFARANALEAFKDIAIANAHRLGEIIFALNTTAYADLKGAPQVAGYPKYQIDEDDKLIGYRTAFTQQLNAAHIVAGIFNQLWLGEWGMLDINVDISSLSTSGSVRIVGLKSVDFAVRHLGAFTVCDDFSL